MAPAQPRHVMDPSGMIVVQPGAIQLAEHGLVDGRVRLRFDEGKPGWSRQKIRNATFWDGCQNVTGQLALRPVNVATLLASYSTCLMRRRVRLAGCPFAWEASYHLKRACNKGGGLTSR